MYYVSSRVPYSQNEALWHCNDFVQLQCLKVAWGISMMYMYMYIHVCTCRLMIRYWPYQISCEFFQLKGVLYAHVYTKLYKIIHVPTAKIEREGGRQRGREGGGGRESRERKEGERGKESWQCKQELQHFITDPQYREEICCISY